MRNLVLAAVAALVIAAPAFAAESSSPTAEDSHANEIVCKSLGTNTGTRLGARRECHTRAEWDARRQHDQQGLTNSQDNGLMAMPRGN